MRKSRRSRQRFRISKRSQRDLLTGLGFISPWMAGFLIFTLYPTLASLYYSFTHYSILRPPVWAGFDNYVEMAGDPRFWVSLENTLYMVFVGLPVFMVFGLATAMLLNQQVRFLGLFRTVYYMPSIVPGIAIAFLWMWILTGKYGLLDSFLSLFNARSPAWFLDPAWSKPGLILINLWGIGNATLFYLAALQEMPTPLYEAADLDGANVIQKFIHITLPMLTPIILFNLLMGLIEAFRTFLNAYVITAGGPLDSTLFYALYLYRNAFISLKMGYASAMAWLLLLLVLAITMLILRSSRSWVYYAGEEETR